MRRVLTAVAVMFAFRVAIVSQAASASHAQTTTAPTTVHDETQGEPSTPHKTEQVFTNIDVIQLLNAKIGVEVIVATIGRASAVKFDLSTSDLVALKKVGATDEIIKAMIAKQDSQTKMAALGSKTATPAGQPAASNQPTAVEQPSGRMAWLKGRVKSALTREPDEPEKKPEVPTQSLGTAGQAKQSETEVKLYLVDRPKEGFKQLGRISAGKYNFAGMSRARDAIDAELKKKAVQLGGNAVINITEDFADVSGVVVKVEKP